MLRFRKSDAKAAPVAPSPAGSTPADKAQALLALLGDDARKMGLGGAAQSASGAEFSQDHLRRMARELIAQVEGQGSTPKPKAAPPPEVVRPAAPASEESERRHVFSRAAPLAPVPAIRPQARTEAPPATMPGARPQIVSAMPTPMAPARVVRPIPIHSAQEVRRLVRDGYDHSAPGREHAAIVALTLEGKPPLEQAAALRQLPRGQIRGVHRALRLLEMSASG